MDKETKKVCDAMMQLIGKICDDCGYVPGGFELKFGTDDLSITAKIDLDYDIKNKPDFDKIIERFITRMMENDEKK